MTQGRSQTWTLTPRRARWLIRSAGGVSDVDEVDNKVYYRYSQIQVKMSMLMIVQTWVGMESRFESNVSNPRALRVRVRY
jgi:hypothetical protein